jgi:hypothetical protein
MSAMEIKQTSCTQLTRWMVFHADNVSNGNYTNKPHTTHSLDGISYMKFQQCKSSRPAAHDLQTGGDFMKAISEMEIKQKSSI